jgi:hypothetical protein
MPGTTDNSRGVKTTRLTAASRPPASIPAGHRPGACIRVPPDPYLLRYFRAVPVHRCRVRQHSVRRRWLGAGRRSAGHKPAPRRVLHRRNRGPHGARPGPAPVVLDIPTTLGRSDASMTINAAAALRQGYRWPAASQPRDRYGVRCDPAPHRHSAAPPAGVTPQRGWLPIKPGLFMHGLRHSHKTWIAVDGIPSSSPSNSSIVGQPLRRSG